MQGTFLSLSVLLVRLYITRTFLLCTKMKSFALLLVDAEILGKAIFIISDPVSLL